MKQEGRWAIGGIGLAVAIVGYLDRRKRRKKQQEEWDRQREEINDVIKKHEEFLAEELSKPLCQCTVELEDGRVMDFGEYLDEVVGPWINEQIESEED